MLPSSVRRVVSSAPQAAAGLASALPRAAVASTPVVVRGHQRRFSSSKPSRPDNGSSEIAAGQSVPASSSRHGDGKASGDKRKRKNKESSGRDASFKKLPSVPATHHMSHEGMLIARKKSRHWPLSPSLSWTCTSPFANAGRIFYANQNIQPSACRASSRFTVPSRLPRRCPDLSLMSILPLSSPLAQRPTESPTPCPPSPIPSISSRTPWHR